MNLSSRRWVLVGGVWPYSLWGFAHGKRTHNLTSGGIRGDFTAERQSIYIEVVRKIHRLNAQDLRTMLNRECSTSGVDAWVRLQHHRQ